MADGFDFAIAKNSLGRYDISFNDAGDVSGTSSFDTAILMTVFCERRAAASEVSNNANRRGWWGNTLSDIPDFEIGSKAWLLEQSRLTEDALNLALTYYRTAFQWFLDEGYANSVVVMGNLTATGIYVKIILRVAPDTVGTPLFDVWLNTGVNVQVVIN